MTTKHKSKKVGLISECPFCEGTGAIKTYTFEEVKELQKFKHNTLRSHIIIGDKRFNVYLHIEEE